MSERTRALRRKVVDRAPLPFLTHPHEVFLAFAVFVIAVPLVSGYVRPESISSQVPLWQNVVWAWSLFAGAVFTLWGLFRVKPRVEWSGQLLMGWGCAFYVLALVGVLPNSGVAAAIFTGVAGVSFWSAFLTTSAPYVQLRLAREARDAHRRAHTTMGEK